MCVICMCSCRGMCVCMRGEACKDIVLGFLLYHFTPHILRQGLPLKKDCTDLTRLAGQ